MTSEPVIYVYWAQEKAQPLLYSTLINLYKQKSWATVIHVSCITLPTMGKGFWGWGLVVGGGQDRERVVEVDSS